ncbi:MAG TPA: FUSC family protein [Pseudonocardia sp.]
MRRAVASARGRLVRWTARRDPALAALRKAVRVTLVACVGFFVCRYAVGDATMATYATFGVIALGALADVSGPPATRTRTLLAALPVGLVLVTVGTLLSAHTWSAVLGILVVGFLVSFASVGGSQLVGLATGLQLFYILPCFPPYAPETLPQRLIGLTVGILLLTVADRLLLPAPAPPTFAAKVADAAGAVARFLTAVRTAPGAGHGELAALAATATAGLRLTAMPAARRPTGPGRRDRGITHAAASVRIIRERTGLLDELLSAPGTPPTELTGRLLAAIDGTLISSADALRGTAPPPTGAELVTAIGTYLDRRAGWVAEHGDGAELPAVVRAGVAARGVAESALGLVAGVRATLGAAPEPGAATPPTAWYARDSTARLWWMRLRGHLTPRSVYLQNALRLALGLALARTLVDVLDLSHGLWVLLATLTLMRTSLQASGSALVPAAVGTLAGAVFSAGLLIAIGDNLAVYAALLPVAMVVAFAAGPMFGPPYAQGGFTVVVAMLFAQLAPASWQLAGDRLVDVLVGGLIGLATGAAVWPRGGAMEIRRIATATLRAGAHDIVRTVDALTGFRPPTLQRPRTATLGTLFESTFAQYRSEPAHDDTDWLGVLEVTVRLGGDAEILLGRHQGCTRLPWSGLAARLDEFARLVAGDYRQIATAVDEREPATCHSAELVSRLHTHPLGVNFAAHPYEALRALDAWGWLYALSYDLGRVERALDRAGPAAAPAPSVARAT